MKVRLFFRLFIFLFFAFSEVHSQNEGRAGGGGKSDENLKVISSPESFPVSQELISNYRMKDKDNKTQLIIDTDLAGPDKLVKIKHSVYIGSGFDIKNFTRKGFVVEKLYIESISIIAHKSNNLNSLSADEIAKIMTYDRKKNKRGLNWRSFGRNENGKIVVHSPLLFNEYSRFMRKELGNKIYSDHEHSKFLNLINAVGSESNAIGFVNPNYINNNENIKTIKVLDENSASPEGGRPDAGSEVFAKRVGYIIYPKNKNTISSFMRFVNSEDGEKSIIYAGMSLHQKHDNNICD